MMDIVHRTQEGKKLKGPSDNASITLGREQKQSWWAERGMDLGESGDREEKREHHQVLGWVSRSEA